MLYLKLQVGYKVGPYILVKECNEFELNITVVLDLLVLLVDCLCW